MIVAFEYKDNTDKVISVNYMEKEFSDEEILVMLNAKEIAYPVNTGILYTVKNCKIENSVYDMFTQPYRLKITLREK